MIAAYVYPGWHPIAERDLSFHPGFTEWELVESCRPRFEGHAQPRLPSGGRYDDRDPARTAERVTQAVAHGVDALVFGFFWCRGKRVFQDALDLGFLASPVGDHVPFALMWANRMPRRVLPVRRPDLPVIEDDRLVSSDVEDFVRLVDYLGERYFRRSTYLRVRGRLYFSIFDSTFFMKEMGAEQARLAVAAARDRLRARGLGELHLAAIEPARQVIDSVREIGFDSVTHYVHLPEWRGPLVQDYREMAARRAGEWADWSSRSGLPYFPSVAPGWDASPRGADFGEERPGKYPWSPVVTGEHPDHFAAALARALDYSRMVHGGDTPTFIASLNEWSEGHYLEPDLRFGTGWLEAVRRARGAG